MKRNRLVTVTLVLFMGIAWFALAHMRVNKTAPEDGSTIAKAPNAIQVWFTQNPDSAVSKMSMSGPSGEVDLYVHLGGNKSLMGMVQTQNLGDGNYTVNWQTAGDDGHIQKGDYTFTVESKK